MSERKWRAKVGCTLIMKNEEKVLARALESMKGCWDEDCLLITDTGSTDRSIEIAKEHGAIVEHFRWIQDFGAARQYSLEKLYEHCPNIDFWMWFDCDDKLMSPDDVIKYREILDQYLDDPAVMGLNFPYIYGHEKNEIGNQGVANFKYHRLRCCKRGYGKWKMRIHEFIEADATKQIALGDVVFHHFREGTGVMNTKRNLEILRIVVDECTPEERPRLLFYMGKECTYNGLWDEAIKAFEEYLPMSNWLPEKHRAMYELAECYRNRKEYDKAREYAFKAINLDRRYADPWIYLAKDAYEGQDYKMAIAYAAMVPQLENPQTQFFDFVPFSTYTPYDYMQASYHFLGNNQKAKECLLKCMSYKPHDRRYLNNYSIFSNLLQDVGKIGIIIPTLNRKERLLNCLKFIRENAYIKNYEIYIGVDGNEQYFNELNEELKGQTGITLVLYTEKSTVPVIVEDLVDVAEKAGCKYVTYLGDDTEPLVGFLIHAYEACEGKNLVAYNDKVWKGEIACHWFAPIELRKQLGGFFFYKGYNHVGCDNELTTKAKLKGLYKFCENAYVDHVHYIKGICSEKDKVAEYDECYKLAWGDEEKTARDRKLLEIRTKNNFIADTEEVKINIGSGSSTYEGYLTLDKYCKSDIQRDIFEDSLFVNESVDKFLCEHVLEHFSSEDAEKVMKIFYNALKKGGELDLVVPDVGRIGEITDESYKLKVLYGWRTCGVGMFHLFGYNVDSLCELFKKIGFDIISCQSGWSYDAPDIRIVAKKTS